MDRLELQLDRYRGLVDDWAALLDASRRPLPLVVWANPLRAGLTQRLAWAAGLDDEPGECLPALLRARGYTAEAVGWYPGAYRVQGLDKPGHTLEHYLGLMHVQEEISMLPALVLGALPGERILDLCAAPGGKSACIAVGMNDAGTLVANDVRPNRLRALRSNCERLGVTSVVITPIDGTRYPLAAGPFDRILLDVPCSCEGNLRVTPGAAGNTAAEVLSGRAGLQATLLGRAWKLLAPGGMLVYATCTFAPEENEIVLDYVLGEDASILPFSVPGLRQDSGVTEWEGKALRGDCRNLARYWPHLNDTGGFTAALVRKHP